MAERPEIEGGKKHWEKYFIQPWDIDGKSIRPHLDYIKEFGVFLKEKYKSLIGICIVGSTFKGYAKLEGDLEQRSVNPKSDIDIFLVVGDKSDAEGLADLKNILMEFNLQKKCDGEFLVQKIHVMVCDEEGPVENYASDHKGVAGLLYPGLGELQHVRDSIKDWLQTKDPVFRNKWFAIVLEEVRKGIDRRIHKAVDRRIIEITEYRRYKELFLKRMERRIHMFFDPDYKQWLKEQVVESE